MPDPTDRGVYLLLIRLPRATVLAAKTRSWNARAGYYAYVGRAMGGLAARLARHLRTSQVRHWHVDSLLAAGRVVDVQVRLTADPQDECLTAAEVRAWPEAEPLPGFGASDCNCPSHLTWFASRPSRSLAAAQVLPRLPAIFSHLRRRYENVALRARDPFHSLVSCILSLRTRDPVTDAASQRLLAELQTPEAFAAADPARIDRLIYPVGMHRQKAERLIEIASVLGSRFDGSVPSDVEALTTLPGVGRKTANLVRSFAFHLPAVCVDTHVHRITNRWGLVRTPTPDDTERELRLRLPREHWIEINPLLVQHGQQICRPTGPRCDSCPLVGLCGYPRIQAERALLDRVAGAPPHPTLKHVS